MVRRPRPAAAPGLPIPLRPMTGLSVRLPRVQRCCLLRWRLTRPTRLRWISPKQAPRPDGSGLGLRRLRQQLRPAPTAARVPALLIMCRGWPGFWITTIQIQWLLMRDRKRAPPTMSLMIMAVPVGLPGPILCRLCLIQPAMVPPLPPISSSMVHPSQAVLNWLTLLLYQLLRMLGLP